LSWHQFIAYGMVTIGVALASYYGVNYMEKLQSMGEVETVATVTQPVPSVQATRLEAPLWLIIPPEERPKQGEHFADLYIPKLKAKLPVIEGTQAEELTRGVGHFMESVLPGEPDNVVLSGHRDTFFHKIGELQEGDQLHVQIRQATFVYVIKQIWVTHPDDRTVIVPHHKPVLTLTTCYPFSYVGPAPERYIIQAVLQAKINKPAVFEKGG
jgi:sortase A